MRSLSIRSAGSRSALRSLHFPQAERSADRLKNAASGRFLGRHYDFLRR
jgi:hypothetical protein